MFYRRSTELALQAAALVAWESPGRFRRVHDLAARLRVPPSYLAKVVQPLARAGVLRSRRGPGGGIQLARPPHTIRLWEIVSAVEPMADLERCVLGLGPCSEVHSCPAHEAWVELRRKVLRHLHETSLGDVMQAMDRRLELVSIRF